MNVKISRILLKSVLLTGLMSALSSAFALPPKFEYRLLPVDVCKLPDIPEEDVECCICQLVNQPSPVKSCLDAGGDVGSIGKQVVCKIPTEDKRNASDKSNTSKSQVSRRPPSQAEDGKIWGNSQWGKANQPPPLYPNDYPEEKGTLPPPPKGIFYPTPEQIQQYKSFDLKNRAKLYRAKIGKPPFGMPPPIESKTNIPPFAPTPTDPTAMDKRE